MSRAQPGSPEMCLDMLLLYIYRPES